MINVVLVIFGILVVIFMLSGCSFKYFDPQWYKYKKFCNEVDGKYIYNKKINDELEKSDEYKKIFVEYPITLSSGIVVYMDVNTEKIGNMIKWESTRYYYNKKGKKCLIATLKSVRYTEYGLWLKGDEGRGFWFKINRELGCIGKDFYMDENGKWVEKTTSFDDKCISTIPIDTENNNDK